MHWIFLFEILTKYIVTFGSTNIQGDEPFLKDESQTVLHVESLGHVLHAFVNGKLAGKWNNEF